MDVLSDALARLAMADTETELSHPPGLRPMTKDHSANPLFHNPILTVSHPNFPNRKPRVPLGMFFAEPNKCLHAYSIDPESMNLIRQTDSRQGCIEEKVLGRIPISSEDLLEGHVTHNQALSHHAQFLLVHPSGQLYTTIEIHEDDGVRTTTHTMPCAETIWPLQLLWTGEFLVALCRDHHVRSWASGSDGDQVFCTESIFDAIGYVESVPDAVLAAHGEAARLDLINLSTGQSVSRISYAPSAFQMFDEAHRVEEARLREPVQRVWGWLDFSSEELAGLSWVITTETMWHQYMIGCKQTLHHKCLHGAPIAATVSDDHSALLLWRPGEGLVSVDMFGLKRWISGRSDLPTAPRHYGGCRITTWADNAVSILLPSGWMQTHYFRDARLPPQLVPMEDQP